jgi:hypothetical protein
MSDASIFRSTVSDFCSYSTGFSSYVTDWRTDETPQAAGDRAWLSDASDFRSTVSDFRSYSTDFSSYVTDFSAYVTDWRIDEIPRAAGDRAWRFGSFPIVLGSRPKLSADRACAADESPRQSGAVPFFVGSCHKPFANHPHATPSFPLRARDRHKPHASSP